MSLTSLQNKPRLRPELAASRWHNAAQFPGVSTRAAAAFCAPSSGAIQTSFSPKKRSCHPNPCTHLFWQFSLPATNTLPCFLHQTKFYHHQGSAQSPPPPRSLLCSARPDGIPQSQEFLRSLLTGKGILGSARTVQAATVSYMRV